jgi:hypothetical protein
MPFSRVALIAAFGALAAASSVRGDPMSSEALAKNRKDNYECHQWASHHTGFDPKQSAPSEPPRKLHPLDPVPGGPGGAMLKEARRRDDAKAHKRQREQEEADFETRRANYERVLKTCLEGRGAAPVGGR